jgi:hypothetical protein
MVTLRLVGDDRSAAIRVDDQCKGDDRLCHEMDRVLSLQPGDWREEQRAVCGNSRKVSSVLLMCRPLPDGKRLVMGSSRFFGRPLLQQVRFDELDAASCDSLPIRHQRMADVPFGRRLGRIIDCHERLSRRHGCGSHARLDSDTAEKRFDRYAALCQPSQWTAA